MPEPTFTPEQRQAIETTGRNVLVAAAAGSGKTTVLAERCAGLIAGASGEPPCRADALLVVTFTDAAAAHMRARIAEALRALPDDHPQRRHIDEQLALLPAAPISTIHSFCRDLIRRWFPAAGVDPQADVLSAEEALLLQHETMTDLLDELYQDDGPDGDAFRALVEEDFTGDDTMLVELVLGLHDFVRSLPNPDAWLDRHADPLADAAGRTPDARVHALRCDRLRRELAAQHRWIEARLASWDADDLPRSRQLEEMQRYRDVLAEWRSETQRAGTPAALDAVCTAIREFSLSAAGRRPRDPLPEPLQDRAKAQYKHARETLLQRRLQKRLARFSHVECVDGLRRVAPKQRTLVALVRRFDARYRDAKAADNVLDFADLEQRAFGVLSINNDPQRPSEVARRCRAQLRHVLVDEFQDVSPIQAAILHLVSREAADDADDNLFTVGDVKQSIYAFRLAEPRLFLERAARFRTGTNGGCLVSLRRNFRSRPPVLAGVNGVFERCMTDDFAEIAYDEDAALHPGLEFPPAGAGVASFAKTPVELHVLEAPPRNRERDEDKSPEDADADETHAADETVLDWHRVEREAHLIAQRIRDFVGRAPGSQRRVVYDRDPTADGALAPRPIEFRDIVILMRAPRNKSDRLAEVLTRFGIPVRAETRGGYFETSEIRDTLALLSLLDNAQQDIPLAAVLRSPLAAPAPFSAGDLVRMRLHAPDVAFHEAVHQYAAAGADPDLRRRLSQFFDRIDRFRHAARRRPLADVIWSLYDETAYLAYVGGLPGGRQRRANLIGLHDRARQFGTFRRQGLRRFLHFIDQLRKRGEELAMPSAASEADNVVRILSVHHAKGLEFPVVFVADLGAQFNLSDARRPVVTHGQVGIGMQVVDPERRIRYPSLLHQVAADAKVREALAEELRILYVAMTRAREHLVLVGTAASGVIAASAAEPRGPSGPLDPLALESAGDPMQWLLMATRGLHGDDGAILVTVHATEAIRSWELPGEIAPERRRVLERYADLGPLPDAEPVADNDPDVTRVLERIRFEYVPAALTAVPARRAVTELKRPLDVLTDAADRPDRPARTASLAAPQFLSAGEAAAGADAAERGTLTHRFLQWLDLRRTDGAAALGEQLTELIDAGRLPRSAERVVDVEAVAHFFSTELGHRLREQAAHVTREIMFVSRSRPDALDAAAAPIDDRDVVLIRGMIDAVLPAGDGLELIDYKTDTIAADQVVDRVERYRPQLETYAQAAAAVWRRPVTRCWLVFLTPRQVVSL